MRWLIPREHGAYGQLGFPMATAIAAGYPTAASLAIVVACVAAFVAHEPALVLLGGRGGRARRETAEGAVRTLLAAIVIAGAAAAAAMWFLDPGLRWTLAAPGVLAALAALLVVFGVQKTLPGELHVALTLCACALPVGAAAGVPSAAAAIIGFVFALGYGAATVVVHAVIAQQRREPAAALRVAAAAIALVAPALVCVVAERLGLPPLLWTAAVPLSVIALAFAWRPPAARHLRRIGWGLIAGSAITATLLVAVIRSVPAG